MDIDLKYTQLPALVRRNLALHFLQGTNGFQKFCEEIKQCKGQYVGSHNRIQFEHEKDYTWFLLKWL